VINYNLNDGDAFGLISGANEKHRGVELKTSYKLTKNFQLNVNGSLSDWKYTTDATATTYGSTNEPNKKTELWLKGLRIANAPQLSVFAEAEYRWAHNFYIRANYYRAQQSYMPFGLYDFSQLTDRTEYKQAQLPKYDLIGASANYLVKFRKLMELNLILGVQNILDTEYIERSFGSAAEGTADYTGNRVYYGPGRTWFAGLRMLF
jgi:outer membrane receptor protein involved in Fe transport